MMKSKLILILDSLNQNKTRATRTAVQQAIGLDDDDREAFDVLLGKPRPYASWIVDCETGLPSSTYGPEEIHPELTPTSPILTEKEAVKELLEGNRPLLVADCLGNNCAVICPQCDKVYCVSGFLNKKEARKCPHCGDSAVSFARAKAIWERTQPEAIIEPEQTSTRLTFKKEWFGHDVWVTFTEEDVTYRYPHDQLLQTCINRLGIIENTKSWKQNGLYHFPRLSEEQKRLLQRYVVDDPSEG